MITQLKCQVEAFELRQLAERIERAVGAANVDIWSLENVVADASRHLATIKEAVEQQVDSIQRCDGREWKSSM